MPPAESPPNAAMPRWVLAVQFAVAAVVLGPALVHLGVALPGQAGLADLPGTVNFHWLIQTHGVGAATESSMMMHPSTLNRIVLDGIPLDALASWPLTAALGWPTGFTVFVWLSFAALGTATAWLSRMWWGSSIAAAAAGVVAQTHPFLVRELVYGRPTQVFGAIFLPLALGLMLRRLADSERRYSGLFAGVAWGLGTLSYWFYGAYFGVGLLVLLATAGWTRLESAVRAGLEALVGLGLVVIGPLLMIVGAAEALPGQGLGLDSMVTHGDHELSLRQLIEFRDLGASIAAERVLAAQLVVAGLAMLAIRSTPRHRWLAPVIWLLAAMAFAAGPAVNLPGGLDLPGPFLLFDATDLTRRNWWPDRALVLAVPAVALMVGGGARALIERLQPNRPTVMAIGVCGLLTAEAFLAIPGLPLKTTWGAETPKTLQLAAGSGPTLVLPLGTNGDQPDARMMIDQIHHGRALVNGPMPYTSSTAPAAYASNVASTALAALVACETNPAFHRGAATSGTWAALGDWGVTEVFLDPVLASRMNVGGARYQQCIEAVLGPTTGGDPLLVFQPRP